MLDQLLNWTTQISIPICESLALIAWFNTLSGYRMTKKKIIATLVMLYIVNTLGCLSVYPSDRATLASTLSIVILVLTAGHQLKYVDRSVVLFYAISSSLLTYWLINLAIVCTAYGAISADNKFFVILLVNCISLLLPLLPRWMRLKLETYEFLVQHKEQAIGLLVMSIFLRGINDMQNYWFASGQYTISIWRDILWLFITVTLVLIPIISYKYEIAVKKEKQHRDALGVNQDYVRQLEHANEMYRFFKHDYQNILSSLECGIQAGNLEDIKTAYYSVVDDSFCKLPQLVTLTLHHIEDLQLRSIVLVKYQQARKKDVVLLVSSDVFFETTVYPKDGDFYRVIGILLDNAIEAAEKMIDRKVNVIFGNKGEIVIINSCKKSMDVNGMFQMGYSTKRDHAGLGLNFVERYMSQHTDIDHVMLLNNGYFVQKIIFGNGR